MKTLRLALLGTALLAVPALAQPSAPPAAPGAAPASPGAGPARGPHRGPLAMFQRVDADRSGRVTWEESWGFVQQRFAEADRNRDGALVLEEVLTARLMPAAERPGGGPQGGPPGSPRGGHGRQHGGGVEQARMVGMMFRAIDANRDNRVTLEEIRPVLEAQFRALDVNADNGVTLDELPARGRGRHGPGHRHHGPAAQPPATQPG
jgi:hypothetical protein